MKRLLLYLGIIVGLFAIVYGINAYQLHAKDNNIYGIPAKKLNPLTVKQLNDPNYQNIILPPDLQKRLSEKKPTLVYFFSPDCPHCKETTPFLTPMAKEMGVDIKQYNLLEFRQGWDDYKIQYTPTLVYFKDGKEADRIEGGFRIVNGKPDSETEKQYRDFLAKYKVQ